MSKKILVLLLLFCFCFVCRGAERNIYPSFPKGITLEGEAKGMPSIKSVEYKAWGNKFIINGKYEYKNPIYKREFLTILDALRKDEKFGISVIGGSDIILYGKWERKGGGWFIVQKLYDADEFFRGVVFGIPRLYRNYRLPGRYKPLQVSNRTQDAAVWFNFYGFKFVRRGNEYLYAGCSINVNLVATSDEKAEDGGYKPDENATVHEEDRKNVEHIKKNAKGYLDLRVNRPIVRYGAAAAFIRLLISGNVNMDALEKQMGK